MLTRFLYPRDLVYLRLGTPLEHLANDLEDEVARHAQRLEVGVADAQRVHDLRHLSAGEAAEEHAPEARLLEQLEVGAWVRVRVGVSEGEGEGGGVRVVGLRARVREWSHTSFCRMWKSKSTESMATSYFRA